MPVTFMIPGPLRPLAHDRAIVRLPAARPAPLSEALAMLWRECPAVRDRVLTEQGEVRPHINIFVDGESIRDLAGLATRVGEGAEVFILPAVSGG
jgi:molybdopterin converting factor small subunit